MTNVTVVNDARFTGFALPSPTQAPGSVGVLARTGIFNTPAIAERVACPHGLELREDMVGKQSVEVIDVTGLNQFRRPGRHGGHGGVNGSTQDDVGRLVVVVTLAQDLLERVFGDVLLGPGRERARDEIARLVLLARDGEQLAAVALRRQRRVGGCVRGRRRDDLRRLMHGDGGAVVVDQRAFDAAMRVKFAAGVLDLLRQVVFVALLFLGIEFGF